MLSIASLRKFGVLCLAGSALAWAGDKPAEDPAAIRKEVEKLSAASFEERERATDALAKRGPEALGEIFKAAQSKDLELSVRARTVLKKMGWPSPVLVEKAGGLPPELTLPHLLEALRTPAPIEDPELREAESGRRDEDLLNPSIRKKQDAVFQAIGLLERQPKEKALEGIDEILKDGDGPRYYAVRALARIGGDGAKRRLETLANDNSPVSWAAAPLLHRLGDKTVCDRLVKQWNDELKQLAANDVQAGLHWYNLACVLTLSGRGEEAYEPLAKALKLGQPAAWAAADPDFDAIRDTPRFKAIVDKAKKEAPPEEGNDGNGDE